MRGLLSRGRRPLQLLTRNDSVSSSFSVWLYEMDFVNFSDLGSVPAIDSLVRRADNLEMIDGLIRRSKDVVVSLSDCANCTLDSAEAGCASCKFGLVAGGGPL